MNARNADENDVPVLARLNRMLIEDEGHRNIALTMNDLERRMAGFLAGGYRAVLFEDAGNALAYALFRDDGDSIHLRQLFVSRDRRRQGLGRQAVEILRRDYWPPEKRIVVEALITNHPAIAFWKAMGFREYCLNLESGPMAR
jgi:GNAT superfamily N-acetyltransferase